MTDFLDLIEQAPEACTLATVERPLRISEFAEGEHAAMTIEVPNQYTDVLTALTSLVGRTRR